VVDARSRAALPGAVLEWLWDDAGRGTQAADADGRIRVTLPDGVGRGGTAPMAWFESTVHRVVAAGHFVRGRDTPVPIPSDATVLDATQVEHWIDEGVWRVPLDPRPDAFVDRVVRLLDSDGHPASGASLFVTHPISSARESDVRLAIDGTRRTGEDGLATLAMGSVVGLDAYVDQCLVASWGLAATSFPERGARELRLPTLARIRVELVDVPVGGATWTIDELETLRSIDHESMRPRAVDEAAASTMSGERTRLPTWQHAGRGTIPGDRATILLALRTTDAVTVHLSSETDRRVLPIDVGALASPRIERSWRELGAAR
jgi:hypothetical protein